MQKASGEVPLHTIVVGRLRNASQLCGAAAALIGLAGLAGWFSHTTWLVTVLPEAGPIRFNTALGMVVAGTVLVLSHFASRNACVRSATWAGAAAVFVLGTLLLAGYVGRWDFGIDTLLFRPAVAGHTPPHAAFEFVLVGMALAISGTDRGVWVAQGLALVTGFIALMAVAGYIYGVPSLWGAAARDQIALHAAAGFFLLAMGILLIRPDKGAVLAIASDTVSGVLARRLLPALFFIPILLGWIRLKGEQAGLYSPAFGLSLFATCNVAALVVVGWYSSLRLLRLEQERSAAQWALAEKRAELESILNTSQSIIYLKDLEGRYLLMNPKGLAALGRTSAEVIGKTDSDIYPSALAETIRESDRRALQEGAIEVVETIPGRDGIRTRITERSLVRDPSSRAYAVCGISIDITQLKQAEAERSRLLTLIEQTDEVLIVTDASYHIIYTNPAFTTVTGYSRETVAGQRPGSVGPEQGDLPASVYEDMRRVLERGRAWEGRLNNKRPDGTQYELMGRIVTVRGPDGNITNYVGAFRDVTQERVLEEQLHAAQRLEIVGRLAAGVAHDFNNLLTIVLGYCSKIRNVLGEQGIATTDVDTVIKTAERASNLTKQLLAFGRKQILKPAILNINEVAEGMEKMLRPVIGENIDIKMVLNPGLRSILADKTQIEQIIMNLTINARDAMPKGGAITIETVNTELDEKYCNAHAEVHPGSYVVFALSDTGEGMDEATRKRIFEPFFTTKSVGKGSGLGLATVYGIVRQSGGYIWVYSEVGYGTTFKIYFPAVHGSAEAVPPSPRPSKVATTKGTILLVEDETALRELMTEVLRTYGYTVIEAADGVLGLEAAEQHQGQIDVLVTDIIMPRLGGHELGRILERRYPDLIVLYLTGYTENAIAHQGVLDPGVNLLQKPFLPDDLVRTIEQIRKKYN